MLKKILIFLLVFSFILSFPFSCFAETVETELFSISAEQMYSLLSDGFTNYFDYLQYDSTNDILNFRLFSSYPKISLNVNSVLGLGLLDSDTLYKFALSANGCHIYIRTYENTYTDYNESVIVVENVRNVYLNFLQTGGYQSFSGFSLSEVPDVPPSPGISGNSSDFGTFIMPLVTTLSTQTWNVFSNCWWALALVLLPLVYLIIVSVINLFRFVAFKISPKYKFRFIEKFKLKYDYYNTQPFKFTFRKFGIGKNKKKPSYSRFVYIDGVRYYAPNYKKMHNLKNSFDKKTDYSDKKYDIVDIEVD